MPFDAGPGELDQAGAAIAVAEDPVVVPELAGLAEVPAGDPAFRLVRVAPCGPLAGEFPHVVVQGGERPGRHHCPVIGRPAPEDRKSTRLNSSHEWISYAVFCLKKKKKNYV